MSWRMRILVGALALSVMPVVGGVAGAQFFPINGEIPVNGFTISSQAVPAVSIAPGGEFVVVWQSETQDGDQTGIFGRQFETEGVALSGDFQVNMTTAGSQSDPALDMDADGDFVVVWDSQPGAVSDIFGRRFTLAGQAVGNEFKVNTYSGTDQESPDVAVRSDGSFIVVWESDDQDGGSNGVFGRRYNSAGTPLATPFQVNAYTIGPQQSPTIGVESDGDFVVAWRGDDGANDSIWARRFTSAGTAQGIEFRVNTPSATGNAFPDLAIATDSSFIIAWEKFQGDGSGYGIVARRFSASASPLATEFLVNSYTSGAQSYPSVGIEADGDFVIAWDSDQSPPSYQDVLAQRYFASGTRDGIEFRVNSTLSSQQFRPAVAADPARPAMVIAWEDAGAHDGDAHAVFAQRYGGPSMDIDGNGAVEPLTDSLLFLRYVFGFRGGTLIAGAVAGNCTRCSAAQIEAFIDGLM